MERTEEEQAGVVRVVDALSPGEFFKSMRDCFGTRRMIELIGYAVLWGVLGVDDLGSMRRRYEEAGLSERSMYRAAADYKKFGDYLFREHNQRLELKEMLRRMQNRLPDKA
jgi:hypothetical protein